MELLYSFLTSQSIYQRLSDQVFNAGGIAADALEIGEPYSFITRE
ncbi:MAG: hypothetical protein R3293_19035 [Candidatus Promineifilaceae bacterium]|nr:hypothetical protein [Candidatus Promineifilaceae bacterium]